MKRITKATFKSFLNKNRAELFINVKSKFDGMTDGCESRRAGFQKIEAEPSIHCMNNSLGIKGLWLVNGGGDGFRDYDDGEFVGFEYHNCCGHGVLAIKKSA